MLLSISIENFALIDKASIEFSDGFNVITGETGAGKSILVGALSLLMGGRADTGTVRSGCEKAYVEGVFSYDSFFPENMREEMGIKPGEDIFFSREISTKGRNICRINMKAVPLGYFRKAGAELFSIYGQHDYQKITDSAGHVEYIDLFLGREGREAVQSVRDAFFLWNGLMNKRVELEKSLEEEEENRKIREMTAAEIRRVFPEEHEEEYLEEKIKAFDNREKIAGEIRSAYNNLYGNGAAHEKISAALNSLEKIDALGFRTEEQCSRLNEVLSYVEDISTFLRSGFNFDYESESGEDLRQRLFTVRDLKRKYSRTEKELLEYLEELEFFLDSSESGNSRLAGIRAEEEKARKSFMEKAEILGKARTEAAGEMADGLLRSLEGLNMKDAAITVKKEKALPGPNGIYGYEMLFSANKGEEVKSLGKIASGGELSRIMLGFQEVFAQRESGRTMIFDEIDSGVGGETIKKVAEKVVSIAKNNQVMTVSHSPHIAAGADYHYYIHKKEKDGRTVASIKQLGPLERKAEIVRLLGGDSTSAVKQHADELLNNI